MQSILLLAQEAFHIVANIANTYVKLLAVSPVNFFILRGAGEVQKFGPAYDRYVSFFERLKGGKTRVSIKVVPPRFIGAWRTHLSTESLRLGGEVQLQEVAQKGEERGRGQQVFILLNRAAWWES